VVAEFGTEPKSEPENAPGVFMLSVALMALAVERTVDP
jgi:hypothetical protein